MHTWTSGCKHKQQRTGMHEWGRTGRGCSHRNEAMNWGGEWTGWWPGADTNDGAWTNEVAACATNESEGRYMYAPSCLGPTPPHIPLPCGMHSHINWCVRRLVRKASTTNANAASTIVYRHRFSHHFDFFILVRPQSEYCKTSYVGCLYSTLRCLHRFLCDFLQCIHSVQEHTRTWPDWRPKLSFFTPVGT